MMYNNEKGAVESRADGDSENDLFSSVLAELANKRTLRIERTRSGRPAIWESGGGLTNTGSAWVVAAPDGGRKRPLHVRSGGHLAAGNHALFEVAPGDVLVAVRRRRHDYDIEVMRIASIEGEWAQVTPIATFKHGEWEPELPTPFESVVAAAVAKSRCYHCREPHWAARG